MATKFVCASWNEYCPNCEHDRPHESQGCGNEWEFCDIVQDMVRCVEVEDEED